VAGDTGHDDDLITLEVERGLLLDAIPGVVWTVDRDWAGIRAPTSRA
jgi:hypothetical protein